MLKYLIIFGIVLSTKGANLDQFLNTLGQIESSGNPKAYNKIENAKGIYQIRYAYFKDAADYDKSLAKYTHEDCFNPEVAKKVVLAYFRRYEKDNLNKENWEVLSRLHNSGPNWRNKKELTNRYWLKIKDKLP